MAYDFEQALAYVLEVEQGKVDRPDDPGKRTAYGITQSKYDTYRERQSLPEQDVFDISPEEVSAIYREMYWVESRANQMEWPLNLVHFDGWVQHLPEVAASLLQRAVGAVPDGLIGPKTMQAVADAPVKVAATRLVLERMTFYAQLANGRPSLRVFLRGWINRLVDLKKEAGL